MMRQSQKAVYGMIETGLRIIESKPALYFHKTFSFPFSQITDEVTAKKPLVKLLDELEKEWKYQYFFDYFISFYFERRDTGCLHIHMAICFYDLLKLPFGAKPESIEEKLRLDLKRRWRRIIRQEFSKAINENDNGGKLVKYDTFDLISSLGYFLASYQVAKRGKEKTIRGLANMHGYRNNEALTQRSSPKTAKQIKEAFRLLYIDESWSADKKKAAIAKHDSVKKTEPGFINRQFAPRHNATVIETIAPAGDL